MIFRSCLLALAAATAFLARPAACSQVFVSPDGDDSAAGTEHHPLRTLARARDVVRHLPRVDGQATTVTLSGEFALSSPLVFTSKDSGTRRSPIVWKSASTSAARRARISGGRALKSSGFSALTARGNYPSFPPSSRPFILQFPLDASIPLGDSLALSRAAPGREELSAPVELVFGDRLMTLARWPNSGWTRTGRA